jgi:RNA polymerase sigma-70 factor (ECF subfamily)
VTEDEGNQLLLSHTAWVHALARSLVAERDLAADVAQETMLVAWRRGLAGVLDVRAWLAQIARRLASRRAQSEQTRRVREQAHGPRDPAPATAELVAKASMQREVVDAVLRLDEPYRTTVLLRFLEERSYQQIAEATAAPIETVRTRIKRGLQQLRQDLDRRHGAAKAWAVPILGFAGFQQAAVATVGAVSTAAVGAAGAGVLTMSMQAKIVFGVGVLCAGMLAWQFWPAPEGTSPAAGPTANEVVAAVAAVRQPSKDAVATERSAAEVAAGSQTEPRRTRPDWTASGRIVDEATNQAIAGAVIAFPLGMPKPFGRQFNPFAQSAADGTFTLDFELPSPGLVELEVEHSDYASTHIPLHEIVAPAKAASSQHAVIGDVMMARGGALSGRVLAADGTTPVPRATIRRYRATMARRCSSSHLHPPDRVRRQWPLRAAVAGWSRVPA